ncbi:MAG: hypothetical protein JNM72_14115, partial [Deltaproteobacteria bacterium]|nr:hypothetical protein [Deltaproteobacteria bacterium]
MAPLVGWARGEQRRLRLELALSGLCGLVAVVLIGLQFSRSPAGGAWAAVSTLCAAAAIMAAAQAARVRRGARPTTPGAVAASWDGGAVQAPHHGLASAALSLSAGAGVGAPDLIALALDQARAALAARPHQPAPIRPPGLALALVLLGLLFSPSAALRPPAGPAAPSATAPVRGAAVADRPVLLDVVDAILGASLPVVAGGAGGAGVGGGAGAADGVAAGAAGGAGDSSGAAAQGAGAEGRARAGAAGSSPGSAGEQASPPPADAPERPPEVPEAVQLM